ncbi:hypothetical protein D3C87_1321340 [compost metagenome]
MVADAAAVIAGVVHHLVHRQRLAAGHGLHQRLVVGQRSALDGVAVVQQQAVREFLPRRLDQRGHALEAERWVIGQLEVVVAADVGVEVGGFQQRQRGLGAGRHRGRRGAAIAAIAAAGGRGIVIGAARGHQGHRAGQERREGSGLQRGDAV